jgi:hypothetical protein
LLERHHDPEESRILGKVFASYVRGQIDHEQFLRIAKATGLAFMGDQKNLSEYYAKSKGSIQSRANHSQAGLMIRHAIRCMRQVLFLVKDCPKLPTI